MNLPPCSRVGFWRAADGLVPAAPRLPTMANDAEFAAARAGGAATAERLSPRVEVVLRLWQCDKENHGCRVRKSLEEE
jgi:hypothetical protein